MKKEELENLEELRKLNPTFIDLMKNKLREKLEETNEWDKIFEIPDERLKNVLCSIFKENHFHFPYEKELKIIIIMDTKAERAKEINSEIKKELDSETRIGKIFKRNEDAELKESFEEAGLSNYEEFKKGAQEAAEGDDPNREIPGKKLELNSFEPKNKFK